jgi:anti-anti-sigma regulatory factor
LVFSLFGKKNPSPAKKPAAKTVPGKPAPTKPSVAPATRPSAPPTSAPGAGRSALETDDHPSLDFSSYVPATKRDAIAAKQSTPATAQRGAREPDSIMSIEVTTASGEVAPVIEETAILFANGQTDQALAKLTRAVREEELGASGLQCWLMLFDLYQHLGRRDDFESLALEFVVKFERSAPAWREGGVETRANPALLTGGTGYCAFGGAVSANTPEFDKLRNLAQKQHMIRVELGKIEAIDAAGAERLREALAGLRSSGKEIMLTGEAHLLELLEGACRAGDAKTDRAHWALLFEVYKWFGLQERFEETAVNYAVTFEVSPPSWEPRPVAAAKPRETGGASDPYNQALAFSGDVTGAGETLVKEFQEWAAANGMLAIDMSKVRRVDFVSAGVMLNALSQLRQAGTTIQIRGANEMVAALFEVMGISKVASVSRRK